MRIQSTDDFKPILENINFVEAVSDDVKNRFDRVKSLILMSFYNFELLDVAADCALLTVQLAIAQRYEQLQSKDPKHKRLKDLIDWGAKGELFESNDRSLEALRELRNVSAHPRRYSIIGDLALGLIIHVVDVINGMYEDVDLRSERKRVMSDINKVLQSVAADGAIIDHEGSKTTIFKATLVHYENRVKPAVYYFVFWSTFNLTPDETGSIEEGEPVLIKASGYNVENHIILLTETDSRYATITIRKLDDGGEAEALAEWIRNLKDNHKPEVAYVEFTLAQIRAQLQRATH